MPTTRTKKATKPAWQKLSWHAARRQWKKFRAGRTYYLGSSGVNKSDRQAHDEALREWEKIVAELEHDQGEAERAKLIQKYPREHHAVEHIRAMDPDDPGRDVAIAITQLGLRREGLERHPDFRLPTTDQEEMTPTIGGVLDGFLAHFQALASTGGRTQNTVDSLRPRLEGFREWAGADTPATQLNAATLGRYHTHLLERIAAKEMSPAYAHDHLRAAKQVIRWAWQNEVVEALPRNLDTLHIQVPLRTPKTLEVDQVHRLLDAATTNRGRLYLSLALLTGMMARDMASLKHSEIDLKAGRITRKRSKTQRHESVPTVSYPLPAPVIKLLRQEMTKGKGDDLVLHTTTGKPLVHGHRNDSVKAAFQRVLEQAKKRAEVEAEERRQQGEKRVRAQTIDASMKTLRSTSATMFEHHERFKSVTSLWLGHAPASVKERHYTKADQKLLDEAVVWLVGQYGLGKDQDAAAG